jgi:tetratricopeptide (TPR) repeat protein
MMNTHSLMTQPSADDSQALAAAVSRLDQFDTYLQEDPDNIALLADAFDAALQCAQWSRAFVYLRHGQALVPADVGWRLREGDFWLAQSNFQQAKAVLTSLASESNLPSGVSDVVLHNLAYIDFKSGDFAACVERMASRLDVTPSDANSVPGFDPALPVLWLRALHRVGELKRAIDWTKRAAATGGLPPQAAGVASLIALDAGELTLARQWAELAIEQANANDRPIEALVTQSSLALAARDPVRAQTLAATALRFNPHDGRAWSAHAFADLLAGQLQQARVNFAKALTAMPGHIGTWHGQGWTHLLLRDLESAQASFTQALSLDRNFAESHGGLAVVLAVRGLTQPAHEHAELAMRLDKSNLSGRYAQAILSGEVQDADEFQRLIERLLGGRPAPLGGTMLDALRKA